MAGLMPVRTISAVLICMAVCPWPGMTNGQLHRQLHAAIITRCGLTASAPAKACAGWRLVDKHLEAAIAAGVPAAAPVCEER